MAFRYLLLILNLLKEYALQYIRWAPFLCIKVMLSIQNNLYIWILIVIGNEIHNHANSGKNYKLYVDLPTLYNAY